MLRTYGNKTAVAPPKPVEAEFVPRERTKEELRQWESTLNLISLLLKNHTRQTLTASFTKLRRHFQIKKKYSSFLLNKLHLLQRRKSRDYLKTAFSALLSNRINYYTTRKQESDRLRESLRLKAASLIAIISNKLEKVKVRNYFNELRTRGLLKSKMTVFKNTHLFSRLSALYTLRLRQGWTKIGQFGRRKLQNLRRLSRVEKLISSKLKYFQLAAFTKLRGNVLQLKAKEAREKEEKANEVKETPKVVPPPSKNNDRENEAEIRKLENEQKTLNEKKKNLERELAKLEAESEKTLNEFRKEIKRLESENEELGFNNGLLEESNQELERELQSRQKATRKKLSKAEIWENVYNNLIHFLTVNRDKEVTRAALLECLEVPLVPCNVDLQELNDENKVLAELLEEYKKNFPAPEATVEDQPELLPFDVIRKQNRYYYMVLEVLSEWGRAGSKELDQLNSDLTTLQKKLAP